MKQPFMLFPNVESRVWAGILTFTGMIILLTWVIINEEGRMEEFTQRFEGRSVETGAQIFESNCSSCHGLQGYGLTGVAPALNNPILFGYNFFAEFDEQIAIKTAELESIQGADPEREAELETEIGQLQAERLVLEEDLLYDYSDELAELESQLETLDALIISTYEGTEYDGTTGPRFSFTAQQIINARDEKKLELDPIEAEVNAALEAGEDVDPELQEQYDALKAEYDPLDAEAKTADALSKEWTTLFAKAVRFRALEDANFEINRLRGEIAAKEADLAELSEDSDERSALLDEIDALNTSLATAENDREKAVVDLSEAGDIVLFDPEAQPRMEALNWNGSLFDLVESTLISGRPVSSNYWPRPMAAWSQTVGGPLRGDEIENVVSYILNWDREFTVADIRQIRQYAIEPIDPNAAPSGPPVGTDVAEIISALDDAEANGLPDDFEEDAVAFDSNEGQLKFGAELGCAGCHVAGGAGPDLAGIATRAQEQADADPEAYPTARHYLVESIVVPGEFIADGYSAGIMPSNFGTERIDLATLSNIIAYLESLDN